MAEKVRATQWIQDSAYLLVACVFIFSIGYFGGVGVTAFFILQLMIAALVVLTVVMIFLRPRVFLPLINSHSVLIASFCALVFFSRLYSIYPYASENDFLFFATIFCFYCAVSVLFNYASFISVCRSLVVLVSGFASYGLIAYFSKDYMLWGIMKSFYRDRLSATFINPNHFGAILSMAIPVSIYFIITNRGRLRVLFSLCFGLMLIALSVTFSLSSYVGLIGALAVMWLMLRRSDLLNRLPFMKFIIVFCSIACLAAAVYILRLKSYSLHTHWVITASTLRHIIGEMTQSVSLFFFGYGSGSYELIASRLYPQLTMFFAEHAHNEYLEVFIELGFFGFLSFVFFWAAVLRFAYVACARSTGDRQLLIACISAGLFSCLIHMAFDFNFHIPAIALVCLFFVGGLTVLSDRPVGHIKIQAWQRVAFRAAVFFLLVLSVYTVTIGYRRFWVESRVDTIVATRTGAGFAEVEPELERALALAPGNAELYAYAAEAYFHIARNTVEPKKKDYYYGRAEHHFLRAIDLNSSHSLFYSRLADLYAYTGKPQKAFVFYEKAVRNAPMHVIPYVKRIEYGLSLADPEYVRIHADVRFILDQMHPFFFQNMHDQNQFFAYITQLLRSHRHDPLMAKLYPEVDRLIIE